MTFSPETHIDVKPVIFYPWRSSPQRPPAGYGWMSLFREGGHEQYPPAVAPKLKG
jgi:hypothetical protein